MEKSFANEKSQERIGNRHVGNRSFQNILERKYYQNNAAQNESLDLVGNVNGTNRHESPNHHGRQPAKNNESKSEAGSYEVPKPEIVHQYIDFMKNATAGKKQHPSSQYRLHRDNLANHRENKYEKKNNTNTDENVRVHTELAKDGTGGEEGYYSLDLDTKYEEPQYATENKPRYMDLDKSAITNKAAYQSLQHRYKTTDHGNATDDLKVNHVESSTCNKKRYLYVLGFIVIFIVIVVANIVTSLKLQQNPCYPNPCKHDGECILLHDDVMICDCSDTIIYGGPTCEEGRKPVWAGWGSWNECDVTCGGGWQHRQRTCLDPNLSDNRTCAGQPREDKSCKAWPCPDCSRKCTLGVLNEACDICECDTHVLSGRILDEAKRPLCHATIVYSQRPYINLVTTDFTGFFTIPRVCATQQEMLVTKSTFATLRQNTTVINATASRLDVVLQRLELPFITDHPRHKMRVRDESVVFCCEVESALPLTYEWFKDGDIIESSNAKSEQLVMTDLKEETSGLYSCRVCSEAGCVWSDSGNLTVLSDSQDMCNTIPVSKTIRLPDDCPQEQLDNPLEYDVGTCGDTACGDNKLAEATCKESESERFCCQPDETEEIAISCQEYTLPVKKVKSCACGPCPQLSSKIIGVVISSETNKELPYINVYYNNSTVAFTNHKGMFEVSIKKKVSRVSLTFRDENGYHDVMDTAIVVQVTLGSMKYRVIKMKPRPQPMTIDSTEETPIPVVGSQSNAIAKLVIAPNSMYDGKGERYSGKVNVTIDNIDMRHTADADMAPGDFTTVDENGRMIGLRSFGMFSINLSDLSGNPMSIGGMSRLEIDPAMIPDCQPDEDCKTKIWIYNTKTGLWEFSSPLVNMPRYGGRQKRQSSNPVYIADVDVSTMVRWYNIDDIAPEEDRCWAKIIAYESGSFQMPLPRDEYEVTSVLNDSRINFLQRNYDDPISTSRYGEGICVAQGCDSSQSPSVSDRRYTSWLSVTSSERNFLPASHEGNYTELDYTITDGYNIRIKPARNSIGPNGPIYLGKTAGFSGGMCSLADPARSQHFQFYMETSTVICNSTFKFYPSPQPSLQSYCFIRIRIQTSLLSVTVVAISQFQKTPNNRPELYGIRTVQAKKSNKDYIDVCMEFRCSEPEDVKTIVDIRIRNENENLDWPITINPNTPDFESHLINTGNVPNNSSATFHFCDPETYGINYGLYRPPTFDVNPFRPTCNGDKNSPQNSDPDNGNCPGPYAILIKQP